MPRILDLGSGSELEASDADRESRRQSKKRAHEVPLESDDGASVSDVELTCIACDIKSTELCPVEKKKAIDTRGAMPTATSQFLSEEQPRAFLYSMLPNFLEFQTRAPVLMAQNMNFILR